MYQRYPRSWLLSLLAGFSLVLWPLSHNFPQAVREAGSALLTLGFSAPASAAPAGIVFVAQGAVQTMAVSTMM